MDFSLNLARADPGLSCLEECLAVLLDAPEVPKLQKRWWRAQLSNWLVEEHGLVSDEREEPEGTCIAKGPSPRATAEDPRPGGHAVIWRAGEGIVHDPHPSGDGLPSVDYFMVLLTSEEVRERYDLY